jgi:hypothetical protein
MEQKGGEWREISKKGVKREKGKGERGKGGESIGPSHAHMLISSYITVILL